MVSSAKGGVGKSTTAVNLAVALALQDRRVGLLDVDIFGPSIPRMMKLDGMNLGNEDEDAAGQSFSISPSTSSSTSSASTATAKNLEMFTPLLTKDNKLIPLIEYGVKCMSMGFLVPPDQPIVWRGMQVMKAIQQLLWDVEWGAIDVLVIDSPPGTGDVHLSIAQQVILDGAIVVSTPQDVALLDAVKGIEMFKKVDVPVLGLVQNMSYFTCPSCSTMTHIFRKDGVQHKSQSLNVPVLADVPLHVDVCVSADKGTPIVISQPRSEHAKVYMELARKVLKIVEKSV